jgi:hypothetical protein
MKTLKMSLENIQGKLNRHEMKNIMAGSGENSCGNQCGDGYPGCGGGICANCVPVDGMNSVSVCTQ